MLFVHLRDFSFFWPFREANTRSAKINCNSLLVCNSIMSVTWYVQLIHPLPLLPSAALATGEKTAVF